MRTLHYGKLVDSDIPVTGVISIHRINWECWDFDDEICLTCMEIESEIDSDESLSDDERQEELEFLECDSSHNKIIGDWLKDEDGKYYPNPEGEYAAIVREDVIQVVYSKHIAYGALCSPCYVGQADLDSIGPWQAYTLPADMLYTDN